MTQEKSAYLLSELDQGGKETRRLDLQALIFEELEFAALAPQLRAGMRIADFGCGSGMVTRSLAALVPGLQISGYDADPKAVEQCRAKAPGIDYQAFGLARGMALPTQGLDLAMARLVLLHLPRPLEALKEMAACVKPGGLVYIIDGDDSLARFEPAAAWQDELLRLLEAAQKSLGGTRRLGRELEGLMEQGGLAFEGRTDIFISKRALGAGRFSGMFLPVIQFYLGRAAAQGLCSADEGQALYASAEAFFRDESSELSLPLSHFMGRRPA